MPWTNYVAPLSTTEFRREFERGEAFYGRETKARSIDSSLDSNVYDLICLILLFGGAIAIKLVDADRLTSLELFSRGKAICHI
jgi:hypothetical protein